METVSNHLLTETDLAAYLKVSKRTIQKWRLTGEGPSFLKIGHLVRYSKDDIDQWIVSHYQNSTY